MSGKVYTRGGDAGQTSLLGGVRVDKDDLRIEVYGTMDEGTSALGLARATTKYDDLCRHIIDLQGELIPVMSEAAFVPGGKALKFEIPQVQPPQVERLERLIDHYNEEWIQTGQFVRPGGSPASAAMDMARAIFRRAERRLVSLNREEAVNPHLVKYVNRLSDLLYVLARIDEQRTLIDTITQQMPAALQTAVSDNGRFPGELEMELTLKECDRLIEAGIRRAQEIGVPMVLTVVDQNGDVIESRRMDDALIVSVTLAPHKAYTAATVRLPTHELAQAAQPGQSLFGIDVNLPKITLVGGGLPLHKDGKVVGAVGVSGGSVAQDIDVAQAMVAAY
ncbi:MAG: cob(I)yrinic acid a,c-diamide adenosyltransferase [Chloroflexota bacterium]|nr:cob(I)yrinic acid a,c-diamide adenosyltransferase [Anaerolineales bacterium]MCA9976281.1 cob(I)yrinic acid a,c-diamide adenosyltransferase [Anaerolineales bacterium]MCB8968241.1 cob(I)yrinic acid a,c-diamide adenosyltransferase [Ardenticatenaceae bacterium]